MNSPAIHQSRIPRLRFLRKLSNTTSVASNPATRDTNSSTKNNEDFLEENTNSLIKTFIPSFFATGSHFHDKYVPGYSISASDREFLTKLQANMNIYRHKKRFLLYVTVFLVSVDAVFFISNKFFDSKNPNDSFLFYNLLTVLETSFRVSMILISTSFFLTQSKSVRKTERMITNALIAYSIFLNTKDFLQNPENSWIKLPLHGQYELIVLMILNGRKGPVRWKETMFYLHTLILAGLFWKMYSTDIKTHSNFMEISVKYSNFFILLTRLGIKYFTGIVLQYQSNHELTNFRIWRERTIQFYKTNDLKQSFFNENMTKAMILPFKNLEDTILGDASSLMDEGSLDLEQQRLFKSMLESFQDFDYIYSNIRDIQIYSDPEGYRFNIVENVDFRGFCSSVALEMASSSGQPITFDDTDFDNDYGKVCTDVLMLTKALAHLLNNAIKYANDGAITLRISNKVINEENETIKPNSEFIIPKNLYMESLSSHSKSLTTFSRISFQSEENISKSLASLIRGSIKIYDSQTKIYGSQTLSDFGIQDEAIRDFGEDETNSFDLNRGHLTQASRSTSLISKTSSVYKSRVDFRIVVEDEGQGMEDEIWKALSKHGMPFLYQDIPHRRLEGKAGTGLGLIIVCKIVERLGGKLSMRSKTGAGTKMEIVLSGTPRVATQFNK